MKPNKLEQIIKEELSILLLEQDEQYYPGLDKISEALRQLAIGIHGLGRPYPGADGGGLARLNEAYTMAMRAVDEIAYSYAQHQLNQKNKKGGI